MSTAVEQKWTQEHKDIARRFKAFREFTGLSQRDAATLLRTSDSIVSQIETGTYAGNVERICACMDKAMTRHAERSKAPVRPRYRKTIIAGQILELMGWARLDRDLYVILGSPGIGKTMASAQHAKVEQDVIHLTLGPGCSPRSVLHDLTDALGIAWRNAVRDMRRQITAALKGTDVLVVADDGDWLAHHQDTLHHLRLIQEEAQIGMVILATPTLEGDLRRRANGTTQQFLDRAIICRLDPSPKEDLETVTRQYKLDDETRKVLRMACGGSVRRAVTAVRLATRIGDGAVTVQSIESALKNLKKL